MDEIKQLKKEIEAIKFRKVLTDDENHVLKLRLNARDAMIEELRSELEMLRRKVAVVRLEGTAS